MKKLSLFLLLVIASAIIAQKTFSQIDVVLGVTKTSIIGSESWKDPIGFQLGAVIPVIKINDNLQFRAELNLSLQGANWEEYTLSGKTSLWYINLPLVIRYQTTSGFFGEIGLQPGLLLSAKDKYEDVTESWMEHMNSLDLGLPVGIGYEFKNNFGVGFRVIYGITDITKDEDYTDRNLVFALRGTYKLNLGKK